MLFIREIMRIAKGDTGFDIWNVSGVTWALRFHVVLMERVSVGYC